VARVLSYCTTIELSVIQLVSLAAPLLHVDLHSLRLTPRP